MTKKPKVLLYDIETLFNEGYFFNLYDTSINHNFIKKEKSIITIAYKWLGDKGKAQGLTIADDVRRFKKDPHDDKRILQEFAKVLEEADYIVGHYSDKFDNKFIQSRALINNLPPLKIPAQIDTYKLLKKHFNLNANRLDYVGKLLGFGGKMGMDWSYWVRCAEGDLAAAKKMLAYNKQDVELLEKIFLKLLPHTDSKLNLALYSGKEGACPSCGSVKTQKRGLLPGKTRFQQRMQCTDCGKWFAIKIVNKDLL
jgi:DNA polymerase elongation subunit (family B)